MQMVKVVGLMTGLTALMVGFGQYFGGSSGTVLLIMVIVAPIAAMIVQIAISRQNEFQTYSTAARMTRDPRVLASALQHIEGCAKQIPMDVNPAAAQLAIINPLAGPRRLALSDLFRTHPPTEERIARLGEIQL
jgi:heat shock protein HtpX